MRTVSSRYLGLCAAALALVGVGCPKKSTTSDNKSPVTRVATPDASPTAAPAGTGGPVAPPTQLSLSEDGKQKAHDFMAKVVSGCVAQASDPGSLPASAKGRYQLAVQGGSARVIAFALMGVPPDMSSCIQSKITGTKMPLVAPDGMATVEDEFPLKPGGAGGGAAEEGASKTGKAHHGKKKH
jgi:hypothetical protein